MVGCIIPTTSISSCLLIPNKTCKTQECLAFVSTPLSCFPHPAHLRFYPISLHSQGMDCMFRVGALGKASREDAFVMDMSDFDGEDDEFEDLDGDDDQEMVLPLEQMQKWLQNKPRGFGEGKVYDTTIEDKLLEEIKQTRQAQADNINNLKSNPLKPAQPKKEPELVQSGIRVRLVNLPKKKNVDRDLKSAFKGVSGIVNIMPAVSGNKKTKDPICKGFAFVDFKTEEDATRFVQQFSGQSLMFGKIQKRIKCEMKSHYSDSSDDELTGSTTSALRLMVPELEGNLKAEVDIADSFSGEDASDTSDGLEDAIVKLELEDESKESISSSIPKLDDNDRGVKPNKRPTSSSSSSKKQEASKKKVNGKVRRDKIVKLEIPASARRLKIKEKAVLTDVFTKYGSKVALASEEQS